jgi:hypothetical protein
MSELPIIISRDKDEPTVMHIPECCREGWPDCPHVINRKLEPKRTNPAV